MLRYPQSVDAQQAILAPLHNLVGQFPVCEAWISFLNSIEPVYGSLSTGALNNLAQMSRSVANVFDYLYVSQTQSIYSGQYLLKLALTARKMAVSASLYAPLSNGTMNIRLTNDAQNALSTLSAWDVVQGYQTPNSPATLAYALVKGASIQ